MSIAVARARHSPLVTIADAEFDRLDALASAPGVADDPIADFLAAELDRAIVRPADEIPPNIVRMNSRVAFRIGTHRDIAVRTLVYPEEYARPRSRDDCLSVMTPLGVALIGLRVGARLSYRTGNGAVQYVTVEAVLHQPDAAERASADIEGCGKTAPTVHRGRDPWTDDDPVRRRRESGRSWPKEVSGMSDAASIRRPVRRAKRPATAGTSTTTSAVWPQSSALAIWTADSARLKAGTSPRTSRLNHRAHASSEPMGGLRPRQVGAGCDEA